MEANKPSKFQFLFLDPQRGELIPYRRRRPILQIQKEPIGFSIKDGTIEVLDYHKTAKERWGNPFNHDQPPKYELKKVNYDWAHPNKYPPEYPKKEKPIKWSKE